MDSPLVGGSASSGKHVDCSSDGRGSGGELVGTLDAREGVVLGVGPGGGHWTSWCLVCIGRFSVLLTGFNGHPGGRRSTGTDTGGHPDSSSTTAQALLTGLLTSGWSPGTVGESLLTSSTLRAWSWLFVVVEQLLDVRESSGTLKHLRFELTSVCIISSDLASKDGIVLCFLGFYQCCQGTANSADQVSEGDVFCIPV